MVKPKSKLVISSPQERIDLDSGSKSVANGSNGSGSKTGTLDSGGKMNGNGNGNGSEEREKDKKIKPKAPPKPNKKPERKFKASSIEMDNELQAQERLLDNVDVDGDSFQVEDRSSGKAKLFPVRNHPMNVHPIIVNSQQISPIRGREGQPHNYLFTPNSTLPRGTPSPNPNQNQNQDPNQVIYHGIHPRSIGGGSIGSGSGILSGGGGTLPLPNTSRSHAGTGTYGRTPSNTLHSHPEHPLNTMNGHGNGNGVIYALNSNGTLTPLRRNVGGMTLPHPQLGPARFRDPNQTNHSNNSLRVLGPGSGVGNHAATGSGFNETAVSLNKQQQRHPQNGQSPVKQTTGAGAGAGSSRSHAAEYQRLHRVGLIRAKARTDSYKVIAFICGFFAAILLVMGLASSEWLLATGYRQGLFVYCVGKNESETNVPFVSRPEQATEGCHRIDLNVQAYTLVAAAFCVVSLLVDVFATLLTVLGLRCRDPNKKYKYYRIAVYVMALALVAVLVALVVYPVCFARIMEGSKRPFWEFGWAYGVGWGASIFLFGGVILLLCDKESEEIYYKERTIVQYADTNNKA